MDPSQLLAQISPPLDDVLARLLFEEFIDIERRYVLGDWEPATLNAGQLVEVAARLIYHIDSGNLNQRKGVDPCLAYVEDPTNQNSHAFPHRRSALHLARVLRTLYKFRSQRGAVHIDPDYSANELDSSLVVNLSRWVVSEILRLFWRGDTKVVAAAIREVIRFEVPAVLEIDGRTLVLRTDCTVEEEILLLLHGAGEKGMTRTEVGQAIPKAASSITRSIQSLCAPNKRELLLRQDGTFILTPNGSRRIHGELSSKLALN
jgi:hypothetical protein